AGKGEGLFFARGSHVVLTVEASPVEHRLATTAPRELFGPPGESSGPAKPRADRRQSLRTGGPSLFDDGDR
ncbi:MAG TPA: hypothetical protein VNF73_08885, partial [Candidatus Saccharimonadales bacterium]|nr:hypothetical protein [Candidatus Saccharimonadales bacterium]